MKLLTNFIEKNGVLKLIISLILVILIAIYYNYTNYNVKVLWLMIIPCIYLIPLFVSGFIYAFIIWPISLIKNKK